MRCTAQLEWITLKFSMVLKAATPSALISAPSTQLSLSPAGTTWRLLQPEPPPHLSPTQHHELQLQLKIIQEQIGEIKPMLKQQH